MKILEKALQMLKLRPLCDHCLGRQFALLGHGIENNDRGRAIKLSLVLEASALHQLKDPEGLGNLKILATNGSSLEARATLRHLKRRVPKNGQTCFLCEDRFQLLDSLVRKALEGIAGYEYTTFLVGVELPVAVEEREDEFRATFGVGYGESIRHEFGRLLGKRIETQTGKLVEYQKPDLVIIIDPFAEGFKVQVNPLFVAGRYRKLVRNIPQSKWFCSACWGKGCERCGWTGKLYPESVEELISKPLLEATEGQKTAFHASGREDIDARMLGNGRPFAVEVAKPRKRFLDLPKLKEIINLGAKGKVEVSNLRFAGKDSVRRLKKAESTQKKYRMLVEFESDVPDEHLQFLEEKLSNAVIKQQTPLRVLHRRADLTREKYIYEVKVKRVSPRKVEMQIRCQGGLYVKELVSGDEGRTTPSVSELLGNRAKPLRLDVLSVIMESAREVKK